VRPKVKEQANSGAKLTDMASRFEGQDILEGAVASIPALADYIAAVPEKQRVVALEAAERHYLETARNLGCTDEPAARWTSALMSDLRERVEQIADQRPLVPASASRRKDYSLAEKFLTRATGALALLVLSPVIALIWIGLKAERPDPAIRLRTIKEGGLTTYSFVLGSGWVSRIVRRAGLRSIPSLWHLLNGDTVLAFKDFAEVIQFPSIRPRA
jgi:hypothetical protein